MPPVSSTGCCKLWFQTRAAHHAQIRPERHANFGAAGLARCISDYTLQHFTYRDQLF